MTNIARFSACIALALLSARVAARDEIHGYTLDPPVVVADAGDQILVQVTVRYTYGGSSGDKAHITAWVQRGGKPYSGVQPEVMPVERGPGTAKLYLWFDPATHKQKVQTTEIAFAFAATPKAADPKLAKPILVATQPIVWDPALKPLPNIPSPPPAPIPQANTNPWRQLMDTTVRNNVRPSSSIRLVGSAAFTGPEAVQACAHHINKHPETKGAGKINEVLKVEVLRTTTAAEAGVPPMVLAANKSLYPAQLTVSVSPQQNLLFNFYLFRDGFNALKCIYA